LRRSDGSKLQMAAPEPNPKAGGVMRYGILNHPTHFDVHQSGTVGNIGTQGCMFDAVIRRDPRDSGKTIVPATISFFAHWPLALRAEATT
jgi:hypothetical protein